MNIQKEAEIAAFGTPNDTQLQKINSYAPSPLTKEQVFVFSVRLCDDAVDRDFERFDTAALPALAALFLGKTGIVDHNWSAEKQVARVFDTQVLSENGVSFIKAWAYALREGNDAFLRDVEGGIKKEVSVGCAMGSARCSVCGKPFGECPHEKGQIYDGKLCAAVLSEPTDAYEFSFVAVPAQRNAGVIKAWRGGERMALSELAAKSGEAVRQEWEQLEREAALGREYCARLKSEVLRLSVALGLETDAALLRSAVEKLSFEELQAIRASLQKRSAETYGLATQLPRETAQREKTTNNDYLI